MKSQRGDVIYEKNMGRVMKFIIRLAVVCQQGLDEARIMEMHPVVIPLTFEPI